MPCYHPLKALRSSSGIQILPADAQLYSFTVPCGQCVGCRLERSRQSAMRCMHEASLYEHNSFLTLTYDDAHVPLDGGLNHRHFQLFMKRLRKAFPGKTIRYYMCGEYGGQFGRPHFHVILFNHTFTDLSIWKIGGSGQSLFRSTTLEALWTHGYSSIGSVTFESAAYVARYIMKKVTGEAGKHAYETVDTGSGEIFSRRPEYNAMSLKPGIGFKWFEKYHSDVTVRDAVVRDGQESKPPRYYDKLLKRMNPALYDEIKSKRAIDSSDNWEDNIPSRLIAKEIVANATINQLKRGLS